MKLGTYLSFQKKEDIQVQTSVSRLLLNIKVDNFEDLATLKIRVRAFGSKGSQSVIDRMLVMDLFEITAFKEGYYELSRDPEDDRVIVRGEIEIGVGGALALTDGTYLSVDFDCQVTVVSLQLYAMGGPIPASRFHRYSPMTIQDTIKEIALAGVDSLVFSPSNIATLKMQYPATSAEYEQEELLAIARSLNDLVSFDTNTGKVVCGYRRVMEMSTEHATRAVLEPSSAESQFTIYLLTTETVF